jgi:hypothetical protein
MKRQPETAAFLPGAVSATVGAAEVMLTRAIRVRLERQKKVASKIV